jgi:hypothetical protein
MLADDAIYVLAEANHPEMWKIAINIETDDK